MARNKRQQSARRQAEQEARRKRRARTRILKGSLIGGGAIAVLAFAIVFFWPEPAVGDTGATTWDLPALNGEGRIALADFEGKPTVAAFFASWCTECEWEIPEFAALSDEIGDRVNFVGINSQDNGRGGGDAAKWGIDTRWPLARDIGGLNGDALSVNTFGARGMPMTVVYDAAGQVVFVQPGALQASQLREILGSLGV